MQQEMLMPKMGESITEGAIVKWLKAVGAAIEKDEIILEISTDKVDSEIPTPAAGKLIKILVNEGDTVAVGTPIAIIETDAVAVYDSQPEGFPISGKSEQVRIELTAEPGNRFYSPVVLNIAAEKGIDLSELKRIAGSGLGGRLTKKDLLAHLSVREPSASATSVLPRSTLGVYGASRATSRSSETLPMDHVRKSIAKHMVHSLQTAAHVALYSEVDVNNIFKIRERHGEKFKAREGFSLTYMPFIVEALVNALQEFPLLNASIEGENIVLKKYYNIGLAVAVEKGLIVPNIFNADEKNLLGLARAINNLAARARSKKLKPEETADGTFSISNFGVYGTTIGFPIINQPQVAILGVGAVKKRPVVINDAIAIRPIMYLSLSIDHRLIDGALGSRFLQRVAELLEGYQEGKECWIGGLME